MNARGTVFVVVEDGGTEGFRAPIAAFVLETEANAVLGVIQKLSYAPTVKIIEVPLWKVSA